MIRLRRMEVMAYVERCRIRPGTLGHLYPPGDKGHHPGMATEPTAITTAR